MRFKQKQTKYERPDPSRGGGRRHTPCMEPVQGGAGIHDLVQATIPLQHHTLTRGHHSECNTQLADVGLIQCHDAGEKVIQSPYLHLPSKRGNTHPLGCDLVKKKSERMEGRGKEWEYLALHCPHPLGAVGVPAMGGADPVPPSLPVPSECGSDSPCHRQAELHNRTSRGPLVV